MHHHHICFSVSTTTNCRNHHLSILSSYYYASSSSWQTPILMILAIILTGLPWESRPFLLDHHHWSFAGENKNGPGSPYTLHFSDYGIIHQFALKNFSMVKTGNKEKLDSFAVFDTVLNSEAFFKLANKFLLEHKGIKLNENYPFDYKGFWIIERDMMSPEITRLLPESKYSHLF